MINYEAGTKSFEELLASGISLYEVLSVMDLEQRKIFLNSEIDMLSVDGVIWKILQYNTLDKDIPVEKRKPILLYISSNGGEIDAGFALIDTILCSKTPVYTINSGYLYSMGLLIGLAGHKRYAFQNSKYLLHDGSYFTYNSGAKAQDQMEFYRRAEQKTKEYIVSRSKISNEEYEEKLRIEWYLFAEEAKEKGFVDYIIGLDCELDEII
jgi:ATP-dependent Clp protease protease subunit